MANLKFFYRAFFVAFALLSFVFSPIIYFSNQSTKEHQHITTGEILKVESYYSRAKSASGTVGLVTIRFYNEVQGKEMERVGIITEDEIPNYKPGMVVEIAYTEGHKFLTEDDDHLTVEPSKRPSFEETFKYMIMTSLGLLLIGVLLKLIHSKKLKNQKI